jgi:hypothetical protein
MTAQFSDLFRFHDVEYAVAEVHGGNLFEAASFGLFPIMASTACWRGYVAIFAISEAHLVLDTLFVNLRETKGPPINNVSPRPPAGRFGMFNQEYRGLNHRLDFSGSLLLGNDFIRELYVHMGFHPAWKYKTVIELTFEGGKLTAENDRSARMAEIRRTMLESASKGGKDTNPIEHGG